jgi:SAM-dependent methyltransferase
MRSLQLNKSVSNCTESIGQSDNSFARVLDIGRGTNKTPGAICMGVNPFTAADIVHDFDDLPYPFANDQFDEVVGRHVIEHVRDPMAVMSELHRITRPGGLIKLVAPHWTNPDFATDLTRRNQLNSYSFRNMVVGPEVFPFYTEARFRQRETRVTLLNLWKLLGLEVLINIDNSYPQMSFLRKCWEQYANAIVRGKEVIFEFEVVKPVAGPKVIDDRTANDVAVIRPSDILGRLFSSSMFHMLAVAIFSLLMLFPNLGKGDLSGYDDALYAHEGRQMLLTGDWWNVRYNGALNFEYPPMFIWLEALSMKALGISDFAAKFPSALSAWLTIILVFYIARELSDDFWLPICAAWTLMLSQYYIKYATHAMTDAPFTFFFTLSLFLYIKGLKRPGLLIFCGGAIGAGILTRSVIGLIPIGIILGHQIVARQRQRPRPHYFLGGALMALLLPFLWYFSQYQLHGAPFLQAHYSFVSSKALSNGRLDGWAFARGLLEYPWLLLKYYWPWLPLMVIGFIVQAREFIRHRGNMAGMLVIWTASVVIPLSLAEAKVLRYIMPVFPAFSMLSAVPLAKWLSTTRKEIYLRTGYLALSTAVTLIVAFPKPMTRAADMRELGPVADAHTEPEQRVIIHTGSNPRYDNLNEFLWYSNRFCDHVLDPNKLVEAIRANENGVFIVDTGSYEKLAGSSGVRLQELGRSKNFVCFKTVLSHMEKQLDLSSEFPF